VWQDDISPADRGGSTSVRAQMDAQSAQLWWPGHGTARLAGLGAAHTYLAQLGPMDRRNAASLNAPPLWWEYNNAGTSSNICSTITRDVASVSAPQGLLMPCLGLTSTEMCDASVLWFSASVSALVSGLNALCTFLGLPAATSRNEMKYSDRHCDIHAVRGVKMVPPQSVWKAF